MSSLEQSDAFNRGHKNGFAQGYSTAIQDLRSYLAGVRENVPIGDQEIEDRYNDIYKGLDDPTALEFLQEVIA